MVLTLYVSGIDASIIWPARDAEVRKLSEDDHYILIPSLDNWSGLFDIHVKS